MKRWDQRPFEVRNLFNPAFCGLVLHRAMQGFEEIDPDGIPFSLSLLILPLCLHKYSREVFSVNPRRYLLRVIAENPQLLVEFPARAKDFLPFTFEALGILMQHGCFEVTQDGKLKAVKKRVRAAITGTDESISCQRVAKTIGKEFARINDRVTIYTTFGVRP
jgi:hypothetical protein